MQFLAYIIVLAVSVSTILLELQWLTSPSRQPKPAVQATAVPVPRAKIDGPNVELSPVYPKPEVPRSVGSVTGSPPENAQASAGSDVKPQAAVPAPVETSAKAEPQQKTEPAQTADIDTRVEPKAETSGAAVAAPPSVAPEKTANAAPAAQPVAAKNSCDVQACARAYTSFSAADCTYQPFQGPRQLCVKPPAQAQAQVQRKSVSATREPNADVAREQSKRAEIGRAVQFLRGRRAVDEADFDEPMDVRGRDIMVRRPSWRW
jgi:hypothetical protein